MLSALVCAKIWHRSAPSFDKLNAVQPSAALHFSPHSSADLMSSKVSPILSPFVPFVFAAGPWYADRMQLSGSVVVVVMVDVIVEVVIVQSTL